LVLTGKKPNSADISDDISYISSKNNNSWHRVKYGLDHWTLGLFFGLFFGLFLGQNFRLFFKGWVGSFVRGLVYHMFFRREG